MPTNINPIEPPKLEEVKTHEEDPRPLPLRGLTPLPQEPPDVSKWVRKANVRLSQQWVENEIRCGRTFEMPGATVEEAKELMIVFKAFDSKLVFERGCWTIAFKPRRQQSSPKR